MSGPTGTPTNTLLTTTYIPPTVPFVDIKTGQITKVWWYFLIALLNRTGGITPVVTSDNELLAALAMIGAEEPVEAGDLQTLLAVAQETDSSLGAAIADAILLAVVPPPEAPTWDDLAPTSVFVEREAPVLADAFEWSFRATALVVADTYVLAGAAAFAGAFTALKAVVGPSAIGSLTETLKINGTAVTGVNAVTVNSATTQTFTATGANRFIAGDNIALVIAIGAGLPVGAWSSALYTRV